MGPQYARSRGFRLSRGRPGRCTGPSHRIRRTRGGRAWGIGPTHSRAIFPGTLRRSHDEFSLHSRPLIARVIATFKMFERSGGLVLSPEFPEAEAESSLSAVGFARLGLALRRLREIAVDDASRSAGRSPADAVGRPVGRGHARRVAAQLRACTRSAWRTARSCCDTSPRSRGPSKSSSSSSWRSQFLTEILLRNPDYLEKLTNHKQLADFKSRAAVRAEARRADRSERPPRRSSTRCGVFSAGAAADRSVRRLRPVRPEVGHRAALAAGRQPGPDLPDDARARTWASRRRVCRPGDGQTGGRGTQLQLGHRPDLSGRRRREPFWTLGQRLIKALTESTAEGFLYRVDMRLRPWGRSVRSSTPSTGTCSI